MVNREIESTPTNMAANLETRFWLRSSVDGLVISSNTTSMVPMYTNAPVEMQFSVTSMTVLKFLRAMPISPPTGVTSEKTMVSSKNCWIDTPARMNLAPREKATTDLCEKMVQKSNIAPSFSSCIPSVSPARSACRDTEAREMSSRRMSHNRTPLDSPSPASSSCLVTVTPLGGHAISTELHPLRLSKMTRSNSRMEKKPIMIKKYSMGKRPVLNAAASSMA
mmetsp:Transcript_40729/g.76227  ORF Transcript_40729/g.76227 Transcript_40729/m.76227 type:complete len:222 (+) Transcript_40729:287-952(+)